MNMDSSCEHCEYKKNPRFIDFSICGINLKPLLVVQLDQEDQVVQLSPKERKKSVNICCSHGPLAMWSQTNGNVKEIAADLFSRVSDVTSRTLEANIAL